MRTVTFLPDVPAWTADATDEAYEEIGMGSNLPIPQNMVIDAKVTQPEIGRWGELLVHNYLVQQQQGTTKLSSFKTFPLKDLSPCGF